MDVGRIVERAQTALRQRQAEQAVVLFQQALAVRPAHAPALAGLLAAYKQSAERKGGPSLLDRAGAKTALATALALRGAHKLEAAFKSAEMGLKRDPTDGALVALLADVLADLGHPEAALAAWRFRTEVDERDVEAWKAAGRLYYAMRRIDEARACLDAAQRLAPQDAELKKLRANLAAEGTLRTTRYEAASGARPAAASEEDLRRRLAGLMAEKRFDDALAAVGQALAGRPQDGELLDARGDVLLARAGYAARQAGPAEQPARLAEQLSLEIEEYGRRSARSPTDAAARMALARVLARAGETDRAIESFQAAVADPRFSVECQLGLGRCFLDKGLLSIAERQLLAALAGAGGVGSDRGKEICYHLGLVSERKGDRAGALARYMEIYEVDITYRDVTAKINAFKD